MSMFGGGPKDYWYEEMQQMFEELSLEDITDIFHWILKYKKLEEKED